MTLAEFWRITPRETVMFIQADRWRREQETRRHMRAAWHTANQAQKAIFSRQPPLSQFVPEPVPQAKSPQQVLIQVETLFLNYPRKKKKSAEGDQ